MDDGPEPLSFLGRQLPQAFMLRVIPIAPGCERAYHEADWRDALVLVERGEVELECTGGTTRRFRCGDVLWLSGLPLRTLRHCGLDPVLLVAISRRRPAR